MICGAATPFAHLQGLSHVTSAQQGFRRKQQILRESDDFNDGVMRKSGERWRRWSKMKSGGFSHVWFFPPQEL